MQALSIEERLARVGATVMERGWLSSNNILIRGDRGPSALIDSGYTSHSAQTLALVKHALQGLRLDLLLNTHLHSDHCGGNAVLQAHFPELATSIPPGQAEAVSRWDEAALGYTSTGQECPRFAFQGLLRPDEEVRLGDHIWRVHGAKGHDPHAIVLHQPDHGVLISADALWQNGFGVVFPEIEGQAAFDEVGETLDLIEKLSPRVVVPGHGPVFDNIDEAMQRARSRLKRFKESPEQHLRHAHKVLIKFRLLDWQTISRPALLHWVRETPYLKAALPADSETAGSAWLDGLLIELERASALRTEGNLIINC